MSFATVERLQSGAAMVAALVLLQLAFAADAVAATDLLTIFSLAEQKDPTYREAQADALAAAEGVPQARAGFILPTVAFRGGAARVQDDVELSSGQDVGRGGRSSYTTEAWAFTATQPVYHYDRFVALEQAGKTAQQAQLELDSARQALIVRVSERYFDVLAAQDNLDFARAEKQSLLGQLEQAQQRFEVGLIAITDVQEAQAGYDRAVAEEIRAENLHDNTFEALREVTGSYQKDLMPLGAEFPLQRPDPDDIETWTDTAIDQNLEIAAASIATDIAHEEIRRQYAGHMPTIDIIGRHSFDKSGGRFGATNLTSTRLSVELNVPIYEGGAVVSRTREAEHQHTAALERLDKARRAVHRQTREAFLGVITQISSVKALKQAVVSSKTAVDSTRAGFEVGTRTAVDVVTVERSLFEARRDYSRSRYDYILDILRLKQAAGTLNPDDLAVANSWLTTAPASPAPVE